MSAVSVAPGANATRSVDCVHKNIAQAGSAALLQIGLKG